MILPDCGAANSQEEAQALRAEDKLMRSKGTVSLFTLGLLLLMIPAALSTPSSAQIGIGISVRIGPPALPVYEQPLCPGPGYLWTPGYWAWDDDDGYYWVPGTWVVAPVGMLWTPGYWGWNNGLYVWNAGYWGPHIGFYGGINYGFGYGGVGFVGGEWRGGAFFYNTAVMHVDTVHVTNVYVNRTVIVNNESHVAFNGGEGGVAARPTAQEIAYSHEPHQSPVPAQVQQREAASHNRAMFASTNHGAPAVAATARPGQFSGAGVVRAKAAGAPYRAPAMSPGEARVSSPASRLEEKNAAESRPTENRSAPAANSRPENNGMRNTSRPENNRTTTSNRPATESRPAARPQSAPHAQPAPKPSKPAPKPAPKEEKRNKGR